MILKFRLRCIILKISSIQFQLIINIIKDSTFSSKILIVIRVVIIATSSKFRGSYFFRESVLFTWNFNIITKNRSHAPWICFTLSFDGGLHFLLDYSPHLRGSSFVGLSFIKYKFYTIYNKNTLIYKIILTK